MVKCIYVAVASLLAVVILGGCRTPEPAHAPARGDVELVQLGGTLKLTDGTPVPGAVIVVRCGSMTKSTTTANDGTFSAGTVPGGSCTLSSAKAHVEKSIRISRSLLGDKPTVQLEVPAHKRIVLAGLGRRWVLDPRSSDWVENLTIGSSTLRIERDTAHCTLSKLGCTTCAPKTFTLKRGTKLPIGMTGRRVDYLLVEEVTSLVLMPLALRRTPQVGAVYDLKILTHDLRPGTFTPKERRVVVLGRCNMKPEHLEELEHLAGTFRSTGLEVSVIQAASCPKAPAPGGNVKHYRSTEAGWALSAQPGDVVILDQDGKVVFRRKLDKTSAMGSTTFDDAVSFLDRTWPALAARRRISVTKAASVKTAEAVRLTEQVDTQLKANRFPEAHRLLDRLVQLSPDLAEAHKLRALVRARLGDYTGAMQEVAWWRSSFGSESAEELEDQVKQATKGRLGALR